MTVGQISALLNNTHWLLKIGSNKIFVPVKNQEIRRFIENEVTAVRARGNTVIVYSALPQYELEPEDIDLPWY